jgi:hypothetical protein
MTQEEASMPLLALIIHIPLGWWFGKPVLGVHRDVVVGSKDSLDESLLLIF